MNSVEKRKKPDQLLIVKIVNLIDSGKTKEEIITIIYKQEKDLLRTFFIF